MDFQFIYGRAHSGKTKYISEKSAELAGMKMPLVVVVPEQFTHIAERRLISAVGHIALGQAEVLSFDRMCKRINSQYPSGKRQLGSMGKSLIVSEILADIPLIYYKSVAAQNGFVDVCSDEITEFKKYMISPDDLIAASKKVNSEALSLKLTDIANIYSAYETRLETRFSDSDDNLDILAANLEKHRPYEGITFMFDEFSSFTPQEKNIISIIAAQAKCVYVTFCLDDDPRYSSVFRVTNLTATELSAACRARGCRQLPSIRLSGSYYDSAELEFLEKNLYAEKSDAFRGDCNRLRLSVHENPYTEVSSLAHKILDLVRNHGARYRDISVVCADTESYAHIIRSTFDTYKIPYFIDEKVRVLDHAIVSFVTNILDVYLGQYSGECVINFLKSGCIKAKRDAVCSVDNFISATRASKNTWLSDERFAKALDAYADDDQAKKDAINSIRQEYILSLATLHDKIKGRNTVRFITENIYSYLIKTGFDKRIGEYISYFKEHGNQYLARQYENVWKTLIEVFDTLVYILGDKTVNLSDYRRYLTTALAQQKTGIIPTSLDEVVVGDLMRSKSEKVRYQFVIGAIDGSFPSTSAPQSIITDAEKQLLSEASVTLAPPSDERAYFDRFQIYCVFSHPDSMLCVSYPASDSDFNAVRPAFVVLLLQKMFPTLRIEGKLCDSSAHTFYAESEAVDFLARSASLISRGESADDAWKDVYKYLVDTHSHEKIHLINRLVDSGTQLTRLSPELTSGLFGDEFYTTISRLQRYNACRYSYYLEYMLVLKPRKEFGMESTDIGTLIHSIIENIFIKLDSSPDALRQADKSYFEAEVSAYLDEYIAELCEKSCEVTKREIFSVMRLKDSIVSSLMALRDHIVNSAFVPLGNEIVFDDDNIGCIELRLANGKKVKITGKIDRADAFTNEDGTFIRVVDYKTGNKTFKFTDVFYGLDVQLLVYLNALVDKTPNAHPAGALYFKILSPASPDKNREDKEELESLSYIAEPMDGVVAEDAHVLSAFSKGSVKPTNKLSTSQFQVLGDYVNSIVSASANAMADGCININPYTSAASSPCSYCPYSTICNFEDGKNGECRTLASYSKSTVFDAIADAMKGGINGAMD